MRWPYPPYFNILPTLPHPPLPHPAGERFTQHFSSMCYTSFPFSLLISHICLPLSLQTEIPLREKGVDLKLRLTHQDVVTFIFLQLHLCDLCNSNTVTVLMIGMTVWGWSVADWPSPITTPPWAPLQVILTGHVTVRVIHLHHNNTLLGQG